MREDDGPTTRAYGPGDAAACAALYNRVRSAGPTFVPVDAPSLDHAIAHPDSYHDEVEAGAALIVERAGDAPAGWAAVCRRRAGAEEPWDAVLRALCADPEDESVAVLLRAVRRWAAGDRLVVGGSGGLRFQNGGDGALPESGGLAPALLRAGLRLANRELILEGPVDAGLAAAGPARIEPADDGASSRALVGGRTVGECWVDAAAQYSSHPGAAGHAFVQWIGTEAGWRGRGVARQMWAFTCARLHRQGVRRLSLSTPCDNFPAQAFYLRVGLRVADQGLGFEAPATAEPGAGA